MKQKTLGTTDIQIPPLCVGTMGFSENPESARGWSVDYATSRDIVKAALDAGLNFFDTAPVYADGSSEKALGQALKDLQVPRESVVISTKFYPRSQEEIAAGISMDEHIRAWLEGSLKRLQTEYVDLLYLHMWDWNTPVEETVKTLAALQEEGKIRAYGLSNASAWQVAMANEKALAMGKPVFAAVQNQWNLISREDERELTQCLNHYGMTPIPYASLAAGRLARPAGTVTWRSQTDLYGEKKFSTQKEADGKVIQAVEEIAETLRVPMTAVSLAWLMEKGAVPLAGATRPEQIQGLAQAARTELTPAQMEALEARYVPRFRYGQPAHLP
uniref:aldo/keto reductase n=1 Tax=uncultured Faecalibaculum sp. TaxID=1729681 RepID=UPI002729B33C